MDDTDLPTDTRICRQLTIPPRTRTPQRCATGTGEQLGVQVRSGREAAWAHLAGAIGDPRARFARFDARQAGGTCRMQGDDRTHGSRI